MFDLACGVFLVRLHTFHDVSNDLIARLLHV